MPAHLRFFSYLLVLYRNNECKRREAKWCLPDLILLAYFVSLLVD